MLIFWVIVALLLVGMLLLLLPALWSPKAALQGHAGGANVAVYRDQLREAERDLAADLISRERFEQLRDEIDRRVLEDTEAAAA
ncbi:MAG: c-type cytochrome biogenesis protein CcmI, partial [Burkholderiaceae bacterium]|nr:c-type cytochrome biogenesis protein CcmI [Burkholderiaceae bacterium]